MSGGTLLGSVRDQAFIPFDYDTDFDLLPGPTNRANFFTMVRYIQRSPEKFLMRVVPKLPVVMKFSPVTTYGFYKAAGFDRDHTPNPTCDVFFMQGGDEGDFTLVGNCWPKWTYKLGELHPITKRMFSGMMLNSACKPEGILERYYGCDYMTPQFQEWPDCSGNAESRKKAQTRFEDPDTL